MEAHAQKVPMTRDRTLVYALSILTAALMAVVSVAGLLSGSAGLYRTDQKIAAGVATGPAGVLVPGFIAQDAVNLIVGSILLGSVWLAQRGSLLSFSVFSAELAVMLALQPQLTGSPIDVGTITGLAVFAAAALVPLTFFVRGAGMTTGRQGGIGLNGIWAA